MPSRDDLDAILELGGRAISPYNTQPWRFRLSGDGVDVFILRTKNFYLKLGGVSFMSLGHLLENLVVGAKSLGFAAEISYLGPHLNLDQPIAHVRFVRDGPAEPGLARGLTQRVTNRYPYEQTPLRESDGEMVAKLLAAGEGESEDEGSRALWLVDEEQAIASDILSDLDFVRLSNHKLFREASEYTRFDFEEYRTARDRLIVDSLGLSRFQRWAFSFLARHALAHAFVRSFLPAVLRREKAFKLRDYRSTSGLLFFVVQREDPETYIALGRRVQHTMNELAARDLQTQASLSGLYLLHLLFENIEIFSRSERDIILLSLRDLENLLGTPSRHIAFVVRVGYCASRPELTLRRAVASLLLPPP